MKIAVVGTGAAGLTAAHHLHRRHDLTLFEAGDSVGGHIHTVPVEVEDDVYPVDTGFIVFNENAYPLFTALLGELGVESQPTSMSFSVSCERSGLEYNGESLDKLFAQRRNLMRPRFHRLWLDILRFHREARAETWSHGDDESVDDWVRRKRFGRGFLELYLTPLGAALWSCPPGVFREFPMRFVVEFLENHQMLQVENRPTWRVIRGGSERYVETLVRPFRERIRLRTPVRAVKRLDAGVRLVDGDGAEAHFDHVVMACHSDQALRLLEDPTPVETELLSAFPYQANEVTLHTDPAPLPRNRKAWASWNYRIRNKPAGPATVTYNMNSLQSLPWVRCFNVTLNAEEGLIDEATVVERMRFEHPVFTAQRTQAQQRREELTAANHTSFCGAYWGNGFHEAGVRSALEAVEAVRRLAEAA